MTTILAATPTPAIALGPFVIKQIMMSFCQKSTC